MAKAKTNTPDAESVAEKTGRALVDIPALGLRSGDFATIQAGDADAYEEIGAFDTKAEKA